MTIFSSCRVILIVFIVCLLGACDWPDAQKLPDYWLCRGPTSQKVLLNGIELESYSGTEPVLLEVFNGAVYQQAATALSSTYVQCINNPETLMFRHLNCNEDQATPMTSPFREGLLDKVSGRLKFIERRPSGERMIMGNGNLLCRHLGRAFSFTAFEDE
jgi:hypothetical protein